MAGDGVQVAGLFLGLSARTDKLEKDLAKAKAAVREAAGGIAKEGERASGFFEKIGLSGREAHGAIKNLTAGLLLSAGSMDGVNEKAKAFTETLGAFIAGGPIAGGIVGLTSLFHLLAGGTDEAKVAAENAAKASHQWLSDLSEAAAKAKSAVDNLARSLTAKQFAAAGIDLSSERLSAIDAVRRKMDEVSHMEGVVRSFGSDDDIARLAGRNTTSTREFVDFVRSRKADRADAQKALDTMRGELASLEAALQKIRESDQATKDLADSQAKAADGAGKVAAAVKTITKSVTEARDVSGDFAAFWDHKSLVVGTKTWVEESRAAQKAIDDQDAQQKRTDDTVASILDKYRETLAVAKATTDEERDRLTVLRDVAAAKASGASDAQLAAIMSSGLDALAAKRAREKAEQVGKTIGEHVAKGAGESLATELPKQIDPLLESLGQTVGQGLGDIIFDGITTGGQNAAQIFQSIWQSMLRQAINSWVQSGISQLLGLLGGGGGGGGGGIVSTFTGALVGGGDPLAGGSFPAGVSNEAAFNAWLDGGGAGHASGGHFTDPHLAMIAEGGEGEWVVPDSKVPAFVRAQGGGALVGDIHVHTSNDVGSIATAAAELVRTKILTSGPHRGAVQKAANNTRFR